MGPLSLPANGPIYIDANIIIYTVERIHPYILVLDMFWDEVKRNALEVVSSDLSVMEVLVRPIRVHDAVLEGLFRDLLFASPDVRLIPIALPVIDRAAHLRASTPSLKTPDAIHAATALEVQCGMLLTNDPVFRRMTSMNVTVLSDLVP